MNICYVLHSASLGRFYIGATHEGVEQRLKKHNEQQYGTKHFTAQAQDWQVFVMIPCTDYAQAVRIERHIKKMKSSAYIRNLKLYPEIIRKLLEQHKSI